MDNSLLSRRREGCDCIRSHSPRPHAAWKQEWGLQRQWGGRPVSSAYSPLPHPTPAPDTHLPSKPSHWDWPSRVPGPCQQAEGLPEMSRLGKWQHSTQSQGLSKTSTCTWSGSAVWWDDRLRGRKSGRKSLGHRLLLTELSLLN